MEKVWERKENGIRKNHQGFTLVEVLLAMVVLALIFLPMMGYFTESAKYNQMTKNKQKAVLAAQSIMEDLKSQAGVAGIYNRYSGDVKWRVTGERDGEEWLYTGPWEMDGTEYDVKVEVKAENSTQAEIIPMSTQMDVVIAETGLEKQEAVNYFFSLNEVDGVTMEDIRDGLTRRMEMEFIREDAENVRIKVQFIYTFNGEDHVVSPDLPKDIMLVEDLRHIYFIYNYDEKDVEELEVIGADFDIINRLYLICHGAPMGFHLETHGLMEADEKQVVSNVVLYGALYTSELVDKKEMATWADLKISVYRKRDPQNYEPEDLLVQLDSAKGE